MKTQIKKVLFIINKFAGTGYQERFEGKILDTCSKFDAECTIVYTQERGHATVLARQGVQDNVDAVIAVGGDGTMNEVAQGLIHTEMPMGIVPKGSGNGLARHLKIPIDFARSLQTIFESRIIDADTLRVNGRLSLNVSGVGFDGHIANHFGINGKRGLAGYARLTLNEFLRFHPFQLKLTIDDKHYTREAFIIAIANSSQYGNNAKVAPAALITDQLMHVSLLKKTNLFSSVDFMYRFFRGTIDQSSLCETFVTRKLIMQTSEQQPYHIDGEACGHERKFDIEIDPRSLRLLVPATVRDL